MHNMIVLITLMKESALVPLKSSAAVLVSALLRGTDVMEYQTATIVVTSQIVLLHLCVEHLNSVVRMVTASSNKDNVMEDGIVPTARMK